jgi:hypothetical protein
MSVKRRFYGIFVSWNTYIKEFNSPHLHQLKALCRKGYEAFYFAFGEVLGKF